MFGILNIHKPAGKTSRDVVNRVQRLVRPAKAGHAGTLDPLATGVLVVCVGPATRLIKYVQQLPKRYVATFLLGRRSETDDIESEVVEVATKPPLRETIEATLPEFIGTIQQRPPAFSAIKVAGERAYHLARKGESVELQTRPVEVYEIDVISYTYPKVVLDIRCGSGTYIRAIGRDLADRLGTAAVMSDLARTEIGSFRLGEATTLESLDESSLPSHVLPPLHAVGHLGSISIDQGEMLKLKNGVLLDRRADIGIAEVAAVDAAGRLVAILAPHRDSQLRPTVNFAPTRYFAMEGGDCET